MPKNWGLRLAFCPLLKEMGRRGSGGAEGETRKWQEKHNHNMHGKVLEIRFHANSVAVYTSIVLLTSEVLSDQGEEDGACFSAGDRHISGFLLRGRTSTSDQFGIEVSHGIPA